MRLLAALLLVAAAPSAARADSFVELIGGLMTPVSDDQWGDYVEPSPKLGARFGSIGDKVGGMFMLDWTPINPDNTGFGSAVDIDAHRFRMQIAATAHHRINDNLIASFRGGGGLDVAYVHVSTNIFGIRADASDSDVGLALELGAGLWFKVGSVEVGGEIAFPISFHDDGPDNDVDLEKYTSVDLDFLFGVRLRQ